jgi:hypothetical protein
MKRIPIYIEKTSNGYIISTEADIVEELVIVYESSLDKALREFGKSLKKHIKETPETKFKI